MPKFKPVIRTGDKKSDGTVNIKIRVTHNGQARYLPTDYSVPLEYFNQVTGQVVPGRKKGSITQVEADRINNKLTIRISEMINKCDRLPNIRFKSIEVLMDELRGQLREHDLISLIDDRINQYRQLGNLNYLTTFQSTRTILQEFAGKNIPIQSVDYTFLKRLEFHMKSRKTKLGRKEITGMSINSIGVHMRNIRTIYNLAITMGLVEYSMYPFRKYKILRETTRHRTLTAQEIERIYTWEFTDDLMSWARDMFMLSFFLIGINMKDLFYLTSIEDGRVNYTRSKGKRKYSIKVYPEALTIFNRYPGKKYLLSTMETYTDYRTASKRINIKLKDIAQLTGINKQMTTYYMRHSWATIARSQGVSKDDISNALGHQRQSLEMTEIYIEENQDTVDKANRKVINCITSMKLPGEQYLLYEI